MTLKRIDGQCQLLIIFVLIIVFIFASCDDSDHNTDPLISNIADTKNDEADTKTPEIEQADYRIPVNTLEDNMREIEKIIDESYTDAVIAGLENEKINLLVSKKSMLASIKSKDDPTGDNYVLDVDLLPGQDNSEWLGDIRFEYSVDNKLFAIETKNLKNERTVKTNGENICVVYNGVSCGGENVKHFDLTERFSITEDSEILWEIIIDNPTDKDVKIGTMGLPLRFNTLQTPNDFADIYQHTFGIYGYIGADASYYYVSRFNGQGKALVMVPFGDTMIEYQNFNTYDHVSYPIAFVASETLAESGTNISGVSNTSFTVKAGKSVTVAFKMKFADSMDSIGDTLYELGAIDIKSLPGMVVPANEEISLILNTKQKIKGIASQYSSETEIREETTKTGKTLYRIKFDHLGENRINLEYGDGKLAVIRYFVTEPLEDVIDGVADFISEKQHQTDPEDPCYMGFLPWDMTLADDYGKSGLLGVKNWRTSDGYSTVEWWHFGGDEMGMAPALYLSELNVYEPDEKQIKQLVDYCEIFLHDTMTEVYEDGTLHIHRGIPWNSMGEWPGNDKVDRVRFYTHYDCWRSYNYVHAINTYYNMYLISKNYELDIDGLLEPKEYLDRCYKLLYTFFNFWMYPNNGTDLGGGGTQYGNMGESCFFRTLDALKKEGMTEEYNTIYAYVLEKCKYFASNSYSFNCEGSWLDTAAYEAVYGYAAHYGDKKLIDEINSSNLGTRSYIPTWFLYGSDIFGNNQNTILLRYMTQLGGLSLVDYVINYSDDPAKDVKIAYGSYNAGWAIVNSGYYSDAEANHYAVGWYLDQNQTKYFNNDRNLNIILKKGLVGVSNEGQFGLWGGLLQACSILVDDPDLGLYCYGGEFAENGDEFSIVPVDGFGRRVYLCDGDRRLRFVSSVDKIEKFTVNNESGEIKAKLSNSAGMDHTEEITVKGVASGEYTLFVDGEVVGTFNADENGLSVSFGIKEAEKYLEVIISKN